jgi:acetate---CoA ligase (ADP-forming)
MFLNELEAKQMLKKAGINVNEPALAASKQEAVEISRKIGFPVVLKIVSPDIIHKSDAGGVKVNIKNEDEVAEAYDTIMANVKKNCPDAAITGILVQYCAPEGTEIIIGMTKDSQFGSTLMFGLGGVFVELLKDVSFRVTPIDKDEASSMIKEIKGHKMLTGFRGKPPLDVNSIEDMLVKISNFIEANPQVKELDLNPVIVYQEGAIAVDARINIDDNPISEKVSTITENTGDLGFMFYPESVAIVGASNNPMSRGYDFTRHLIDFGYKGTIYPISLKNADIQGIKAYPDLDSIPGNVEHVIFCIGLENMPEYLDACKRKGVKSIHAFSARGAETGRSDAKELENNIKNKVKEYGIRLLGPNCMGVYCADSGFSFCSDFSKTPGNIGAMIQSGGSSTDIARYGQLRGLNFSKLVSYGNAIDINEMDLLKYLSDDPKTDVIIAFIEGLRGDGRDFMKLVRETTKKKPFIICKGGLSNAGARATMSHTASLAGSSKVWNTAIRQAGGIPVRDLDDLVNLAVAFSLVKPIKGNRVGTGGSGGGRNTVSVDEWETNGFEIVPLPENIKEEFHKRGALLWDCLDNPADRSITIPGDPFTVAALLLEMAKDDNYDFICANIAADDHPYNKETFIDWIGSNVNDYVELSKISPKPFFTIFSERPLSTNDMDHWFWREVANFRTKLIDNKVAMFPSVDKAAEAVNEMIWYYNLRENV